MAKILETIGCISTIHLYPLKPLNAFFPNALYHIALNIIFSMETFIFFDAKICSWQKKNYAWKFFMTNIFFRSYFLSYILSTTYIWFF